ncbi:MAG: 3-methyl-2-oxobutanoate hydroxymethyltransferase [Alphaproteobacteria bacterium]|nr:3-methyl-2-oxobutanoate hydroxymethyltransferase [Alphaproteobacteria bacterium]
MQKKMIPEIKLHKHTNEPLVCLTAYTTPMAKILDNYADLLLVGDSIGMVLYGMENTLGVDLEMMIRHGQAVMRGVQNTCVIVDMPFGSYEESPEHAYRNAARIMKETGCDGVKLEGGMDMAGTIEHLSNRNIPVMAHIGLMPQSVIKDGGYKVKGRSQIEEIQLIKDAKVVEKAGAFSVVIEGTVEDVASIITDTIHIPTIGIGASPKCDGQILVTEDMLGLNEKPAKFVKEYTNLRTKIESAISVYADEVHARTFPAAKHLYTRPKVVNSKAVNCNKKSA